jgi:hypothetical protein
MARCVPKESIPFTTPVPSFTLKPRAEKDDYNVALMAPLFAPTSDTLGRGLRIRSSFDEEDGGSAARCWGEELGEAPAGLKIEPPEWAVKACGEARLEVSASFVVPCCLWFVYRSMLACSHGLSTAWLRLCVHDVSCGCLRGLGLCLFPALL